MYLLLENHQALVIDPHISEPMLQLMKDHKVKSVTILLTHEHYDHISGINWLCNQLPCQIICQKATALSLESGKNSRPAVFAMSFMRDCSDADLRAYLHSLPSGFRCKANIVFDQELSLRWEKHQIHLVATPGHSQGSCCIEMDGRYAATGDSWIPNTRIITRFPGGNQEQFKQLTLPYLRHIPKHVIILPGHGDAFQCRDGDLDNLIID